jgi:hypothetical protein
VSQIPTDIGASAAQAGFQARDVGVARDAIRTGRAEAAERQVKSLDDASAIVDTADGDTAVFTDSEGAGSQGRENEPETPPEEAAEAPPPATGITRDETGHLHIDLEA